MPTTTPDLLTRSAAVAPASFDAARNIVDVVWTTGAAVRRRDGKGPFIEVLSLEPDHVDLSRLQGASVLDSHQADSLNRVMGIVTVAAVDGRQGTATIRFSRRPDVEPFVADVRDGVIRHLSVGYAVEQVKESRNAAGERIITAIRWQPRELSFVPTPADPGATVRTNEVNMDATETAAPAADTAQNDDTAIAARADANRRIRRLVEVTGLDRSVADDLIDRAAGDAEANRAVLDALIARGSRPIVQTRILADHDAPEARAGRIAGGLYSRIDPAYAPAAAERPFSGWRLTDAAADCLRRAGETTTGLAGVAILTRAFHTTSDFPLIVANITNKSLRAAYQAQPAGIRQVARQAPANRDFRAKVRLQFSSGPTPLPVGEHGEYQAGTMSEAQESYAPKRFGRIIGLTPELLVSDDVGAFATVPARLGQAWAGFVNQYLVDLVVSGSGNGPALADTKALFHADHGNKAGSGAAPGESTLSAARLAMRKQKGLAGEIIDIAPRFILVPPDLETTVEKLLTAVRAATTDDVAVFAGRLTLVVEPRLINSNRWYLVADPAQADGLEWCVVEGMEGPTVTTERDFDTDGLKIKVSGTLGAGFVDHRSWFMNPGV